MLNALALYLIPLISDSRGRQEDSICVILILIFMFLVDFLLSRAVESTVVHKLLFTRDNFIV